jgi:hypothetical protein
VFIAGEDNAAATLTIRKELAQGEYLILYAAEFSDLHPLQKLVLSVYSEQEVKMKLLDSASYGVARF